MALDAAGEPIRPEAYSDEFARLCKSAVVPLVRLPAVRHTLALTIHRAGTAPG